MCRIVGIIFLLLGPVVLNGLTGCDTCHPSPYRFAILDYKTYPRKIADQSYKPYLIDTLSLSDSVNFRQLEILLIGQETRVAMLQPSRGESTVWACDPAIIAVDSIKHLTITSNQPYGIGLEAGRNLASILTIGEGSYDQKLLTTFLAMPLVRAQSFYSLRLMQAPDRAGLYQFQINVDWGQGKMAKFMTRAVFIKV